MVSYLYACTLKDYLAMTLKIAELEIQSVHVHVLCTWAWD